MFLFSSPWLNSIKKFIFFANVLGRGRRKKLFFKLSNRFLIRIRFGLIWMLGKKFYFLFPNSQNSAKLPKKKKWRKLSQIFRIFACREDIQQTRVKFNWASFGVAPIKFCLCWGVVNNILLCSAIGRRKRKTRRPSTRSQQQQQQQRSTSKYNFMKQSNVENVELQFTSWPRNVAIKSAEIFVQAKVDRDTFPIIRIWVERDKLFARVITRRCLLPLRLKSW